jgi:hypothetical protein
MKKLTGVLRPAVKIEFLGAIGRAEMSRDGLTNFIGFQTDRDVFVTFEGDPRATAG